MMAESRRPDFSPDAGRPDNGRDLLAWALRRGVRRRVISLGKSWDFPRFVPTWSRDQVHAVYEEITRKIAAHPDGRTRGQDVV